jgi:hypothetical protein
MGTLVAAVIAVVGCGGASQLDGGLTDATTSAGQCRRDPSVVDGGPGACGAARAYIDCEFPNGAGCGCMTNDASCSGCGAGATCTDKCSTNEYAASCGSVGPGNPAITYADPPAACRLILASPAGVAFYCCPCL